MASPSRELREKQKTTDFATRSTRCHADQQKAQRPDERTEEAKLTQQASQRNQHGHRKYYSIILYYNYGYVIFEHRSSHLYPLNMRNVCE